MTVAVLGSAMMWFQPMDVPVPEQSGLGLVLLVLLLVVSALIALVFISRRHSKSRK